MKYTAIVLAGGSGKRMNSRVHKQYLLINGKPVLYYSLKAFEESDVGNIVLVVGAGEMEYCRKEIVEPFGIKKVSRIVEGGQERYHSVFQGLKAAEGAEYVLIHDGARPFLTQEIIERTMQGAADYGACVAGMPAKDTIKIAEQDLFIKETPSRDRVWIIQTPQAFLYPLIYDAYKKILKDGNTDITDDAMVLERAACHKVKLVEGSYQNIKITTPEDLALAEVYLNG